MMMYTKTKKFRNPFLLFLPFLFGYTIVIVLLHSDTLWGDEIRHVAYANNLLNGFYSPPAPNIGLEIGPVYPLLLAPFIYMGLPLITIKLLNAFLLYFSIILLYKSVAKFASPTVTMIISFFWACYYNSLEFIYLMYSEIVAVFLFTLFMFLLIRAFETDGKPWRNKYNYFAGLSFAALVLTKLIFGYALLVLLFGNIVIWALNHRSSNLRKGLFIMVLSFVTVLPYLFYTFSLTGKIFYWGTSGGNNLYWMSSPAKNEYGSWFATSSFISDESPIPAADPKKTNFDITNRTLYINSYRDSLIMHHRADFVNIKHLSRLKQDEELRKLAFQNITRFPLKFIKNCVSNVGRILFNYPYSYTLQKPGTLLRLPFNGFIVVFNLLFMIPTIINWKNIFFPIRFLFIVAVIYFGGSILGSAETRMFTIIVPFLLLWIAFSFDRMVRLKIRDWH